MTGPQPGLQQFLSALLRAKAPNDATGKLLNPQALRLSSSELLPPHLNPGISGLVDSLMQIAPVKSVSTHDLVNRTNAAAYGQYFPENNSIQYDPKAIKHDTEMNTAGNYPFETGPTTLADYGKGTQNSYQDNLRRILSHEFGHSAIESGVIKPRENAHADVHADRFAEAIDYLQNYPKSKTQELFPQTRDFVNQLLALPIYKNHALNRGH